MRIPLTIHDGGQSALGKAEGRTGAEALCFMFANLPMIYKKLGNTGERIPAIGLGTWKIPERSKEGLDAILEGLNAGARFIDTAEMYANERLVGKAISRFDADVFLATKVSPHHFRHDDLIRACDASLDRLGVKCIDLYQLHWPNHSVPIKETIGAMEMLADAGKIRHIGVSNFTVEEMIEAQTSMKRYEIISNQVEYSPFSREPEGGLLQFCQKEHITLIAYSPLGRGQIFREKKAMGLLGKISATHGATEAQVILSYLISKENVVAIPKSSNKTHVKENVSCVDLRLSEMEIKELDGLGNGSNKPLAGRVLSLFLKNTGVWAKIMEDLEKKRKI
jgi:hypothetical protein